MRAALLFLSIFTITTYSYQSVADVSIKPATQVSPNAKRILTNSPSPLSRVATLTNSQIKTLKGVGITSLKQLSEAQPSIVARALNVNTKQATLLINTAQSERLKLSRALSEARKRLELPPLKLPGSYASLITPTNECTILVRKTCGLENQCASSPGCEVSMTLLERYNAGGAEATSTAESCLMALEDPLIFPQCGQ